MICISISADTNQEMRQRVALAQAEPASLFELRLDSMREAPKVEELVAACGRPVMVTCRSGGKARTGIENAGERVDTLRRAAKSGAVYIHGEPEDLARLERFKNIVRIAGMRDDDATPPDLAERVAALCAAPADWVLFAVTAVSPSDNIRVFEALSSCPKPAIGYAMGETGLVSRILATRYGSRMAFGCLDEARATEPGQPTARELVENYRIGSLGDKTDVYGMFDPDYSRKESFVRHNRAFKDLGIDAVCIPLLGAGSADFMDVLSYVGRRKSGRNGRLTA